MSLFSRAMRCWTVAGLLKLLSWSSLFVPRCVGSREGETFFCFSCSVFVLSSLKIDYAGLR